MDESRNTAEELIAAIQQLKTRAELLVTGAEEANRKANSEAGYAYNAKQVAEDHAKAISQVKGTFDADFNWLTTTKANAEAAAQAVAAAKAACEADSRIVADNKAAVEKDAAAARAAVDRVNAAAAAVEKQQNEVAAAANAVKENSAAIAAAKGTTESNAASVQNLQAQLVETASKATADAAAVAKAESNARTTLASISEVATTANAVHQRVADYQTQLQALTEGFQALHAKIEGLLPNATSAGLASAFRNQKARFAAPQAYWLVTFVISIALLIAVGAIGLPGFWPSGQLEAAVGASATTSASDIQPTWDAIWRHFVARLPIVVPLVWLAIYAGRHYSLALRVQEEYAFKEAVSTAFEGYKREMVNISIAGDTTLPPIVTLCENVLNALAQRPGRIYEGRHDDITPFTPLLKTLSETFGKKSPDKST